MHLENYMNLYQFLEKETAAGQTPSEHLSTINTKLFLNGRISLKPQPGQHPGQLRPPPQHLWWLRLMEAKQGIRVQG